MASEFQVKQYLAYWFQLGKRVLIQNGNGPLRPDPVIRGDRYSQEFEDCWQQIRSPESGDCHLEFTTQTITELLSPAWNISDCARCSMPIPVLDMGITSLDCPCVDLPGWPNTEVPLPRSPVSSQSQLVEIRDRLQRTSRHARSLENEESKAR